MRLFQFDAPDGIVWKRCGDLPEAFGSYEYLRNLFDLRRFDAICGGLQRFVEEFITQWVRNCIRATGIKRVALSGGLFMNVKLNKTIMELPEVEDLFVYPSCGDETNAMGAAYYAYAQHADCRNMACGTPAIAGDIPDYDEYYFDRDATVVAVDPNDSDNISTAILRLLDDPSLVQKLTREALLRVQRKGSYQAQMSHLNHLYENLRPNLTRDNQHVEASI